jgi:hypothetical protein
MKVIACFARFVVLLLVALFSLKIKRERELSLSHPSTTQCNGTVFKNETNNLFKPEPSFKLVDTFFTAKVSINFLVLLKMTLKMKTCYLRESESSKITLKTH